MRREFVAAERQFIWMKSASIMIRNPKRMRFVFISLDGIGFWMDPGFQHRGWIAYYS